MGGSGVASVTPLDLASADSVVGSLPPEDARFTSEGIVTTCVSDNQRFYWNLPRGIDVCSAWLTRHGLTFAAHIGWKADA